MLVLSRKVNQEVLLSLQPGLIVVHKETGKEVKLPPIRITLVEARRGDVVRLGFTAPKRLVKVLRSEVPDEVVSTEPVPEIAST